MSLRSRLLCMVLLATLLPALLLGWRFLEDNQAQVDAAVRTLAHSSDNVAASLDQRVQSTAQLQYGLAHSRILDSSDRETCSEHLAAVRETFAQYTGIVTVLPDGQLHCDSLRSGRRVDLSDRNYVKRVRDGARGIVIEPAFGRLTGTAVLQIVYPTRTATGALRFMSVASLNLHRFARETQQQSLLASAEVLILDGQGVVLAWVSPGGDRPRPGTSVAGTPLFARAQAGGTGLVLGSNGMPSVWAVAESPAMKAAGVYVMLGQPQSVLTASSRHRLREGLEVLTGAALLLFAGVWSLAEWGIRRPVARITSMVRDLGQGDLSARIDRPYSRGELGGLMYALDGMAASLGEQRASIDLLTQQLRSAHKRELCERKTNEERLIRMATFDSLTGLPNRSLFQDRLQQAIARSSRSSRSLALMFLDIDRFKIINDSLGHEVGDRLLVALSSVLSDCLRSSDSVARNGRTATCDEVFRLGGDEFMILAEDIDGPGAAAIARRILSALKRPIIVAEHELFVTASIGITLDRGADEGLDRLIKQADMAMYRSKELGRDTFCFFEESMNLAATQRHELEMQIRQAAERGEFQLHYQPKAQARSGQVIGVEALLRWKPPGRNMVAPDQFIGILEETGLIVPVGAWVFREACSQMMAWRGTGMAPIQLAVNVSARQLRNPGLVQQIADVLDETGFPAALLEVELTESMLIDDTDTVARTLSELGSMGVSIAIDDFGTGHSSLRYLKRFNVDTLKIDRSFVNDTPNDAENSAIARAVISIGHGLGMKVVAEGVETQGQLDFLCAHGCDQMQGYLLARPIGADAFADWLIQHNDPARASDPAIPEAVHQARTTGNRSERGSQALPEPTVISSVA